MNYIDVGVYLNSALSTTATYRIKVQDIGSSTTVTSDWITYTAANITMIPSSYSSAGVYLLQIPVISGGNVGLTIPAGNNQTLRFYETDPTDASQPTGTSAIGNFAWQTPSFFSNTYTIGGAIVANYAINPKTISGSNIEVPAIYNWNVTMLCPIVTVTVNPTNIGCCQPITTAPTIYSNTGSNLVLSPIPQPYILSATGLSSSLYYQWYDNYVALSGSSAAGIGVTTLQVTNPGTYTVRVVTSAGFINRASCYQQSNYSVQTKIIIATVTSPVICLGGSSSLFVQGVTGTVNWSLPIGLNNTTVTNPSFTVTSAGIYTYTVSGQVPVGNQIINGDFETGDNTGVNNSSYYSYVPFAPTGTVTTGSNPNGVGTYPAPVSPRVSMNSMSYDQYTIVPNYVPYYYPAWQPCVDHTTGSGHLLVTDAYAANSNPVLAPQSYLWSQSVNVVAGESYNFTAWVTNINSQADPFLTVNTGPAPTNTPPWTNGIIQLYVNDAPLLPSAYTIAGHVCNWEEVVGTYVATTSGTVTLKLQSLNYQIQGNDFGLDDISFGTPGIQTDIATITVTDCNFINVSTTATCSGNVATLKATTNGIFAGWTTTTGGTNGITNPNSAITTVTTSGSNYVFKATAKFLFGEMITNGDFSQGFTGFTSNFNEIPLSQSVYGNDIAVTNNPPAFNASNNTYLAKNDITGDATRNMLLVNAGVTTSSISIVYSTTVTGVVAGTQYGFSMWLANVAPMFINANPDTSNTYPNPKTADVQILINGVPLFNIKQPLDTLWRNYAATWTASSSGTAVIQIKNLENQGNGISGYVIDNVEFSTVYSVTKTATITSPICALPVNYLSFDLVNKPKSVEVDWQTTSEVNNSYFEIERSSDGVNFISLGKVNGPKNGSSSLLSYVFTDYYPLNGTSYYRIKQVDLDGNYTYTPIRSIQREASLLVQLFPNPSDNNFNISIISGTVDQIHASIKDISGKNISAFQFNSGDFLTFGNDLQPGVYLLQLQSGSYVEVLKLVKN